MSVIGVLGTNTGAERCSAPISDDKAFESFKVGVVRALPISCYATFILIRQTMGL